MEKVKLAVIYYSSTGTNFQLAKWAIEGAKDSGLAETRLLKIKETAPDSAIDENKAWRDHINEAKEIPEATNDDLEWSDAFIFSVPTRYGNVTAQFKQFIDGTGGLWANGALENKVVSAMSSAGNPHGGQEATVLSIYTTMCHWGAIIVPPGYTDKSVYWAGGNPYGTTVSAGKDGMKEDVRESVLHQAKRTVEVASWLKNGKTK